MSSLISNVVGTGVERRRDSSPMRPFVVVGCGRSGTKYTAELLTAAGVPCGHEAIFRPREPNVEFGSLAGDSSWYAVPFLDRLPDDVLILHQLREPMAVIRSWVQRRRFRRWTVEQNLVKHLAKRTLRKPPSGYYASRTFIAQHAGEVFEEKTEADRAARYWLTWNHMAENAARSFEYHRYDVADLGEPLFTYLLEVVGGDPSRAQFALASVPTNTNSRAGAERQGPVELSAGLRAEVESAARRWGLS